LRISGIAHDVSLPPGWMDHVVYGFVTPATLAELGAPASLNEIQIVVRDIGADRDAVRHTASDIKELIERSGKHVTSIDVPVSGQHAHAAQMNSLMMTQGAFGLLTLLVCSFLIVNLISAMLAGQTREIGVMKSLGGSARQIGAMYLGFALLLGILASAIALPAAIAIGRPYASLKADMLNFSIAGVGIPWWAIAIQIVAGCLLPVVAAAIPVVRACRQPVSAALRDTGIATETGSSYLRRRISVPGISRPLLLSIGNAFRRRQRMLLTLLVLATGGAVFLGSENLRSSVRESVDLLFSSERYDVVLRLNDSYPAAQSETAAASVVGVKDVQAIGSMKANVMHTDGMPGNTFTVVALPPNSSMFTPQIEQGRWLDASDRNALVISSALQKDEPTLVPGADVRLTAEGEATQWHIVGVESDIQPVAYAPLATLNTLHGNDRAATLLVATTARSAAAQLDVIARLRTALERAGMPVANSRLMSESRHALEDHLVMVVEFLGMMGWVMIIVGGMGLATTMSLAVLERTREIGVMRAIGAPHRTIMSMILIEGLVIAVLGWLVALPLSVPMSSVLAEAFGRVMFAVPVHYLPSASGALLWLLMAVVVSLLACLWPACRATRLPTVIALRDA
jgi:putative ABC transport system permease protein